MYNEVMENTDFVIEHIDKEVKVITDRPSSVVNYPANTDFFIENIDDNVISIAHSLNIEASEVEFRPANTDFFIENIDNNVIMILESFGFGASEVIIRPANTDFFIENIDKNLIDLAQLLDLEPSRVVLRPANTDMFIENIDRNVTLIKSRTNVITKSGSFINVDVPDGGTMQLTAINGNATQDGTPTPDSPQPISTVTGEQVVKVVGKNLAISGITTGGNTVQVNLSKINYQSGNYAISVIGDVTASNIIVSIRDHYTNIKVDAVRIDFVQGQQTSATFSLSESEAIALSQSSDPNITMYKVGSGHTVDTVIDAQLELGSTATTYEPYQGQSQKINLGKNLFDISKVITSGTSLINNGDGTLTVNTPSSSSSVIGESPFLLSDYCPELKVGDTVTLSATSTGSNKFIYLSAPASSIWSFGNSKTITQNDLDSKVYWYASGVSTTATISNIQVENGTTASDYVPYITPIELAKIGTYQDRIYKDDGKWYIEKQVGKSTYDGTEAGWSAGAGNRMFFRNDSIYGLAEDNDTIGPVMSNYFTADTYTHIYSGDVDYGIAVAGSTNRLAIRNKDCADKTAFLAWLASNPTTVYYALAESTTTEITDETLLEQLNFVADMYEGINNISFIGTGAQGTIEVVINKN